MSGRIALVTGASGGVGGAAARALAGAGFRVLATGRSTGALQELRETVGASDGEEGLRTLPADLCRPEDRRRLCDALREQHADGGLDVLVLSHGVFVPGLGEGWDEADLQAAFDTNLTSRALLFRELLPELKRRRGRVFEINTTAARVPRPDAPIYAASMAGCASFFRSTGGAEGVHGRVRICSIFLGRTATPMQEEVARIEARPYRPDELLDPDDVARFIVDRVSGPVGEDLSEAVLRATPAGARPPEMTDEARAQIPGEDR